ncbi:MAG: LPS export ABC transporter periplasmic protein LptC [Paludibacteraceae bacterium]|jgi:LPS export ABC transporter protein LptC|nr:LPS export ABC transporter periplasmic protein LptC [Paludibacteraceae bacterium]MBR4706017.1 LPS export ABC transporter periplasmic protein LptC [Paludibacteraceae bacterium]
MAGSVLLLAVILSACSSRPNKVGEMKIEKTREQLPVLVTDSVTTLISDSGITRYRIEAARWLMYDKTEPPYQEFPNGIYLEQFDEELNVQASLKADYAHYNETAELWTLRGNVHALNLEGEQFDTQELKWDQQTHRVYSDSSIHITREKSIIEGVGFESNEQMTKYTILHPTGIFPVDDEE